MTPLYRLDLPARAVARAFAAGAGDDPWAGGHVAPGQFAPVITTGREFVAGPRPDGDPPRRMVPRLWGVPPPPSAGDAGRAVLSVRNPDSPFWIGNLRNSEFRCLAPATAFMVWGKGVDAQGKRLRHWFACADQPVFAMAAVWKDSEVPGYALLGCEANAALRQVGAERMPVIVPGDPAAQRAWLNGDWGKASTLIAPYPSSLLREVGPSGTAASR